MDLTYYNNEIEKILADFLNNYSFSEFENDILIDNITNTFYQYHKILSKKELNSIVHFFTNYHLQKIYKTDTKSNTKSNTKSVSNSDTNSESDVDRVEISNSKDLICHSYDYKYPTFKESKYLRRWERIQEIKLIPQHIQKSIGWLTQRSKCLTATAVAGALDEDPYSHPSELLLDKCNRGKPFVENKFVHHGKKYEEIGSMYYSFRNNIVMEEYGLIQHDINTFIGASPDGICDKNTLESNKLSTLVGRLLEIKFPHCRKILTEGRLNGDICPHYYYLQVQTQLYVTKMDECDFLQCKIYEYGSWEKFVKDSDPKLPGLSKTSKLEKGCLIQLLPKELISANTEMCLFKAKYIYPPKLHMTTDEIEKWVATHVLQYNDTENYTEYMIDKVIYWRLDMVACDLIKAETDNFEKKIPELKQFWDYILFYRSNHKLLDKLEKYIEEVGNSSTADIFKKVNKDYLSVNPNSKYNPLFQTVNKWRQEYNKKEEEKKQNAKLYNQKRYFSNKK